MRLHLLTIVTCLLLLITPAAYAQINGQHPTPVVIHLTPSPTAMPAYTPTPSIPPDYFEPNNSATQAVTLQPRAYQLTLPLSDVDYFAGILQTGQTLQIQALSSTSQPQVTLFWGGQPVAGGSQLQFTAPTQGNYTLFIEPTATVGTIYTLTILVQDPIASSTPSPTATPPPMATLNPTSTPLPTATQRPPTPTSLPPTTAWSPPTPVWSSPTPVWVVPSPTRLLPSIAEPTPTRQPVFHAPPVPTPVTHTVSPTASAQPTLTTTHSVTATILQLPIRSLPTIVTPEATTLTMARVLVYYDTNNDRAPSPNEGVPHVSVVAVDTQGQPLAQHFTNAQGEVQMQLTSEAVARVIVPFVPGWATRIRTGQANSDIVLGLPAVRLPIFFPIKNVAVN